MDSLIEKIISHSGGVVADDIVEMAEINDLDQDHLLRGAVHYAQGTLDEYKIAIRKAQDGETSRIGAENALIDSVFSAAELVNLAIYLLEVSIEACEERSIADRLLSEIDENDEDDESVDGAEVTEEELKEAVSEWDEFLPTMGSYFHMPSKFIKLTLSNGCPFYLDRRMYLNSVVGEMYNVVNTRNGKLEVQDSIKEIQAKLQD